MAISTVSQVLSDFTYHRELAVKDGPIANAKAGRNKFDSCQMQISGYGDVGESRTLSMYIVPEKSLLVSCTIIVMLPNAVDGVIV